MKLTETLQKYQISFAPVMSFDWKKTPVKILDFTAGNRALEQQNLTQTADFAAFVTQEIEAAGAVYGVGGYNEHRVLYRRSPHFQQAEEPREIHLGIDIWAKAGTPVAAPLKGRIHSFRDNANFGDYGPTIILEHELDGQPFYTLYGHLSRTSLVGKEVGQQIQAGEVFSELGPFPENGDWPPHLHIQVIENLEGWSGDYPGVCAVSQREKYLNNCPDPNLILQIPGL
ncbi:peptidoglycan DD-metalloendopeptidase family protein [Siphonobacter sp. SORGH_AS_0500]|uniref:peptidoglycan DD-metalloendopeptidase family protein n=1 Tax=Siphonobacter sp. SORGH_AS_0500 TaxID=1864824 RepID=UPI00286121A3|nr:peptidoglycan DD-metalloendopeptidase family protein [Siphonobacter sp. SORGH_AS_0500]MDR6193933.1 murein DD-endopeptidase MepM/ murein hydrolase activator NlpD [Siphonobacter sp. SORGH_AS_0500]